MNSFGYGGANAHTVLDAIDVLAPGRGGARKKIHKAAANCSIEVLKNEYPDGIVTGDVNGSVEDEPGRYQISAKSKFLVTPLGPQRAHSQEIYRDSMLVNRPVEPVRPIIHTWVSPIYFLGPYLRNCQSRAS